VGSGGVHTSCGAVQFVDDQEELLCFFDFPAEHWIHPMSLSRRSRVKWFAGRMPGPSQGPVRLGSSPLSAFSASTSTGTRAARIVIDYGPSGGCRRYDSPDALGARDAGAPWCPRRLRWRRCGLTS